MKLIILLISIILAIMSCDLAPHDSEADPPPCAFCPFDFRATDYEPDWSPDGSTIAYVHSDTLPGKSGIYFINPDGTNIRQWYDGGATPSWSPNGQWIAFEQGGQIFKRTVQGDSLVQLTFEGRNFFPDWSPDGKMIAYDNTNCGSSNEPIPENSCGVLTLNLEDGTKKLIKRFSRMPTWGPNKKEISFVNRAVLPNGEVLGDSLWTYTLANSTIIFLALIEGDNRFPKYAPDGQRIVYTSQREGEKSQIWIIDINGNNSKQLTTIAGYTSGWSPDGEWIIYTDPRVVNGRLWLMRPDGTDKQKLTFD